MSVELRPLGVRCNIQCQYCYQNPQRDAGNLADQYSMPKMKAAVEKEGGPFTLFGGEPLLMPFDDLDDLWAWGYQKYGSNSIQTNGALITPEHIEIFKRYNVAVGISVDGPGELNDVRWAGTLEKTRQATEKTHAAIDALCRASMPPSLIVTLHRGNATEDKLPIMHDWVRRMRDIGVASMRLHVLEVESPAIQEKYALTTEENLRALLSFRAIERDLSPLKLDVFADMRNMLMGLDDRTTCVWNGCDPYHTEAVRGIEGHGQTSNCGRTNKDGIDYPKAARPGFERYVGLYNTPQDDGGCAGCRFFLMCKGQCPGTAMDGDWRNRTEHCELWKTLYRLLEEEMLDAGTVPLSASPIRKEVERRYVDRLAQGVKFNIFRIVEELQRERAQQQEMELRSRASETTALVQRGGHGDHTDIQMRARN